MDTELQELTKRVGVALRSHREKMAVKQGDIASKASISISMLSQIERGVTSPSIETLGRVCSALGVSMSQMFSALETDFKVNITAHDERPIQDAHGVSFQEITRYKRSSKHSSMVMVSLESGSKINFGSCENGTDEVQMGYVLSGSATLTVAGKEYKIRNGDGISFPASCAHSIKNREQKSFSLARKFIALWAVSPIHERNITLGEEPPIL